MVLETQAIDQVDAVPSPNRGADGPRFVRPGDLLRVATAGRVIGTSLLRVAPSTLPSPLWRRRSMGRAASRGLVDAFEQLGPAYVKVAQVLASSPGLFPAELAHAARRSLDQVAPVRPGAVRRVIERDLGRPLSSLVADFDDVPLSAASIAQVHACVLRDGREAVFKVRRPGIGAPLNADLRLLHQAARLAALHPRVALVDPVALVRDLHRTSNEELDLRIEAARQQRFAAHLHAFGDNEGVHVPQVHPELCGRRVICMERLHGQPIDRWEPPTPAEGVAVLRSAVKAWLEAACVHGVFHGDLHAGNLWVLDDGRAAFLDFGIAGELPPAWQALLREVLAVGVGEGDLRSLVDRARAMGLVDGAGSVDPERVAMLEGVVAMAGNLTPTSISMGDGVSMGLTMLERFGVRVPPELVLVGKQLLYVERYLTRLAPDWVVGDDRDLLVNLLPR